MSMSKDDPAKGSEAKDNKETFNPKDHTGFHVMRDDGEFLGTYATEADAQAFIDGHMTPQKLKGSIVEGHDPEPDA